MQAQGTDGLSRGSFNEGVTFGEAMHRFCPWGQSAIEREPALKSWIESWFMDSEFLTPRDWFIRGHDHDGGQVNQYRMWEWTIRKGNLVWVPPPAAANVAIEELRKSHIKRQSSTHLIIIPHLFTHLWKK